MIHNSYKKAFTLVELMVAIVIASIILGYAWSIYSSGSETTRHTVAQSQIQSDLRIFLDHLETEMMMCYAFNEVDTENKKFSFYSFSYGNTPLEELYYDSTGNPRGTGSDSDSKLKVKKMELIFEDGKLTQKRTPGYLYFLHKPWTFEEGSGNAFDASESKMEKVILKDITDFEVKGYTQLPDPSSDTGLSITPVTPETATATTFISLRIHALKDEKSSSKRDEEIEIVTKFYSAIRLAEATNPGYFASTDSEGRY